MLTDDQKLEIDQVVKASLAEAEQHWEGGAYQLDEKKSLNFVISKEASVEQPSKIPGHDNVGDSETVIDDFVALVADIRGSSAHLKSNADAQDALISGVKRVYFETSALLPAIEKTLNFENGSVTEYLGDGVLGLFQIENEGEPDSQIYSAFGAAENIITDTLRIANQHLVARYQLPELRVGVGLALSKALVSLVGLPPIRHPNAFGECVFNASKLASGENAIIADEAIFNAWPTSAGGLVQSSSVPASSGVPGYLMYR